MKIEVMDLASLHLSSVPESLYVHYPVCKHICSYCDFNVYSQLETKKRFDLSFDQNWLQSLEKHLRVLAPSEKSGLKTLYLGGGTPSLLSSKDLHHFSKLIAKHFERSSDFEFTLEANPETLNKDILREISNAGVTRLSLGVQSFIPGQLRRLERLSTLEHLENVISSLPKHFKNFSLDWMIGIPDQNLETFETDLDRFLKIRPPHLSVYILTLADDHKWKTHSAIKLVDQEDVRTLYLEVCAKLKSAGYLHYEVSNFSLPGFESKHNRNYWNPDSSYLALGPGAHGYLKTSQGKVRYECIRDPKDWADSQSGIETLDLLSKEQLDLESFYLRLRTRQPVQISEVNARVISEFQNLGFVEVLNEQLFLTESGWLIMESLAERLLKT